MSGAAAFRAEFPVLERVAYLNAGTNGPIPRRAARAAQAELRSQVQEGRAGLPFFEHALSLAGELRDRAAVLLGCGADDLALTGSTTDGVNTVVAGLDLGSGDEVLTSDEEHPGLLAPLAGLRERRSVEVRVAPFSELAAHVGDRTRLVACSHVSWMTGRVVDAPAIAAAGVPLLLDGAQAAGAVPVEVDALGCDFYAASGQKWLCGPTGTGYLYVRPERLPDLSPPWPSFGCLEDPTQPLELSLREGAGRFDVGFPSPHHLAWCLAALDVVEAAGTAWVLDRAADLAAGLAAGLADRGLRVAPRGRSTLVSWEAQDPAAEVERLAAHGLILRHLPGLPYVRASVGAWNSEEELERLVELAAA